MAMTKKFKVSIDVTAVISSEYEENMNSFVMSLAKKAAAGGELNDFHKEVLVQALTYGPEGVASFLIKHGLREMVKDAHNELCESEQSLIRFSPATVREVF